MSTSRDHVVLEVLAFLADIQLQLASFCRQLRSNATTVSDRNKTVSGIECRRYSSGITLSVWVETEAKENEVLTWWMDITPREDGWLLDARLSWNGQDTIIQFPERVLNDFGAVEHEAPRLLEELFATGREVLNDTFPP